MRNPRIALLHASLKGFGGSEKYAVNVAEILAERGPFDLVTAEPADRAAVERSFGVSLAGPRFVTDPRVEPSYKSGGRFQDLFRRSRAAGQFAGLTSHYDLVIATSERVPWRSAARRSLLIVHFPVVREQRLPQGDGKLQPLWTSAGRMQREVQGRVNAWTRLITSSRFSQRWIKEYWRRDAAVLHPMVEQPERLTLSEKRNWILGAGFFTPPEGDASEPWSYKRHEVLIDAFKDAVTLGLRGWELHLAGHAADTGRVRDWIRALRERAEGYPVHLHPNCAREELEDLYRGASIFWHAVGCGISAEDRPERTEHFGIVTAEALGWGCVPVVINCGGQPEIVEDGVSGFLWNKPGELVQITNRLASDPVALRAASCAATERARIFGRNRFRTELNTLLDEELARL